MSFLVGFFGEMIEITCYDAVNGFQVEFWVEDKFNVIN
jgi:hypothetical protein